MRCGNYRGEIKNVSDSMKVTNEKKHNLQTDEMWSHIVSDESQNPCKLRAQMAGETVTIESMTKVGSEILETCLGRSMRRHAVLDRVRED